MTQISFPASRAAGLERLDAFAPSMGRAYAAQRNSDLGPEDRSNISALSPYVRHRLVLETELANKALVHHSESAAEKFIQEVFWRTYWKGWLELRPSVWKDYRAQRDQWLAQLPTNGGLRKAYEDAVSGNTGIDCFDAWANELIEIGYIHNHSRMWFASIWIFTLGLPWELGADHFHRHLLDGDAASNTLSWRWVAGLQTRGKTYLARASNIEKYTNGRFSPNPDQLAPDAPAVDGPDNPKPGDAPSGDVFPDGGGYTLLIHEEDLNFESLKLDRPPERVVVQSGPEQRGDRPLGDAAHSFTQAALDDAAQRAAAAFECAIERMSMMDLTSLDAVHIVCAYAPIGPLRDDLDAHGLSDQVSWLLRQEDKDLWPHATKGFFKFKSKIPAALDDLGLRPS